MLSVFATSVLFVRAWLHPDDKMIDKIIKVDPAIMYNVFIASSSARYPARPLIGLNPHEQQLIGAIMKAVMQAAGKRRLIALRRSHSAQGARRRCGHDQIAVLIVSDCR